MKMQNNPPHSKLRRYLMGAAIVLGAFFMFGMISSWVSGPPADMGGLGPGYGYRNGSYVNQPGPWLNGNEWSGRITSGTIDPNGPNSVYSVDGQVLTLP